MLQPEEPCEHSFVVALYAGCWHLTTEPTVDAFCIGMTHHLHSAAMPDAGYTAKCCWASVLTR
jgi:hypothetical protein